MSDAKAEAEISRAQNIIDAGLTLRVADAEHKVSKDKVYEWLSYSVKDDELVAMLNAKKAETWLQDTYGKQLAVSPGVTTVVTRDFTELSRKTGKAGQAIDASATRQALEEQLQGKTIVSKAVTKTISPTVAYERSYSPTDRGISALLKNFAADHAGSYAMTYIELDGKKRRAEYQGDKQFVTASTYKLFAAYSLLKRVDDGRETWSANADCFDKMIRVSDNPCAEAYLSTFGLTAITNEIQSIGLKNSNFTVRGGPFTTANDLALLLGQLQAKQNFSTLGRDRLLSAMRANIFRQGIPAGSKGQVANKVGFLDGLLHDAAIVYTSSGTYILVVLSDGSSWQNIEELTRQIEKIR